MPTERLPLSPSPFSQGSLLRRQSFLVKLASTEIIIYRRILTKPTLPVRRSLTKSGWLLGIQKMPMGWLDGRLVWSDGETPLKRRTKIASDLIQANPIPWAPLPKVKLSVLPGPRASRSLFFVSFWSSHPLHCRHCYISQDDLIDGGNPLLVT
jgi:hypothetical protein